MRRSSSAVLRTLQETSILPMSITLAGALRPVRQCGVPGLVLCSARGVLQHLVIEQCVQTIAGGLQYKSVVNFLSYVGKAKWYGGLYPG
jgi:hypothetical protein